MRAADSRRWHRNRPHVVCICICLYILIIDLTLVRHICVTCRRRDSYINRFACTWVYYRAQPSSSESTQSQLLQIFISNKYSVVLQLTLKACGRRLMLRPAEPRRKPRKHKFILVKDFEHEQLYLSNCPI